MKTSIALTLALILLNPLLAEEGYEERANLLNVKTFFADREINALAEPFVGLRTSEGIEKDLFPIESTGVSTKPIVDAAKVFLSTLDSDQHLKTVFSVDDPEWRRWCNVDNGIYVRQGVSLKEMTIVQRKAVVDLMVVSLSAKGFELTEAIRKTDQTLSEINNSTFEYDEDLYFFTVMGLPSETEPWGWQVDGHHLIINYFVLGDQVVMTPTFLGGEPISAQTGKYKGNILFQNEQNQGLALFQMLDEAQQTDATLSAVKTRSNNQAEAYKDNLVLDYSGVSVKTFSEEQKSQLLKLIALYVNNEREEHAAIWMKDITAHLNETWFTWIGDDSEDGVFYYRIHSPVILIEFDHQNPVGTRSINKPGKPTRDHIHVVIRTPNGNDYGKDLLRQHLEKHHSD